MRKTIMGGLFLGALSLALGLGSAHADVTVSFDDASGSTLVSAPALPAEVPGVDQVVSGKANFDVPDNGVLVQFVTGSGDTEVVEYTTQADIACDEAGLACAWSTTVPFILAPGNYHVRAIAAEANPVEGGDPISATATIDATIL